MAHAPEELEGPEGPNKGLLLRSQRPEQPTERTLSVAAADSYRLPEVNADQQAATRWGYCPAEMQAAKREQAWIGFDGILRR